MSNATYQKINWGWLNDYNGYKFAPITFVEQLYTEEGYSFKEKYDQKWESLEKGEVIAGAAKSLVQLNETTGEYDKITTPNNKPIYFKDGIPVLCDKNLISNLLGNVNILDQEEYRPVAIIEEEYTRGVYYSKTSDGEYSINNNPYDASTVYYEINPQYIPGNIQDDIARLLTNRSEAEMIIKNYNPASISRDNLNSAINTYNNTQEILKTLTTINGNTINGNTINGNTINGDTINGDITFKNKITITFINDVIGTFDITGSNTTSETALTLKEILSTEGSFGPSSGTTLTHSGKFIVPSITVDKKGRITAITDKEYTLPEGNTISISQVADNDTSKTKRYIMTNAGGDTDEATSNALKYYNSIYVDYDGDNASSAVLMGAAWNDYAEFRDQIENIEPGYCVASTDDGKVYKTAEKFQACDGIVSDTYGFAIGHSETYQTPLAVSGRVLAYCEGNRYDYHAGDTVCAGPEGKVCKMTREEIKEYPDRIIGIISEIPEYEEWTGKKVNNRIWIKVR